MAMGSTGSVARLPQTIQDPDAGIGVVHIRIAAARGPRRCPMPRLHTVDRSRARGRPRPRSVSHSSEAPGRERSHPMRTGTTRPSRHSRSISRPLSAPRIRAVISPIAASPLDRGARRSTGHDRSGRVDRHRQHRIAEPPRGLLDDLVTPRDPQHPQSHPVQLGALASDRPHRIVDQRERGWVEPPRLANLDHRRERLGRATSGRHSGGLPAWWQEMPSRAPASSRPTSRPRMRPHQSWTRVPRPTSRTRSRSSRYLRTTPSDCSTASTVRRLGPEHLQGGRPVQGLRHTGRLEQVERAEVGHGHRQLEAQLGVDVGLAGAEDLHLPFDRWIVDPVVEAAALESVVDLPRPVRSHHHHGRLHRLDRADLGKRHLEVGEKLEQVGLELLVGPIQLVDQKHRTLAEGGRLDRPAATAAVAGTRGS